ncbi:MAG: rod shape-determining protein RodA [Flavobacteriales bacterium]
MRDAQKIFGQIDGFTILLYLLLVFFGWINIYASEYNDDVMQSLFDLSSKSGRQLLFIGISMLAGFFILIIDWRFFDSLSFLFYGIMILFLILVLFISKTTGGANSWFEIGNFKVQPSEFAKFATALALAKMFSINKKGINNFSDKIKTFLIVLIPFFLIILQNDLGTALVFISFILVFYREGLSGNILIFGFLILLLFILSLLINPLLFIGIVSSIIIILFFLSAKRKRNITLSSLALFVFNGFILSVNYIFNSVLSTHHKVRINILLGKEFDPTGDGYNLLQSKIAIGSGGFFGKGFLNGTQTRFDFVPEQSTDFIFCTVGEEWGFLGSLIFILIFITLLIRIISLAEKQKSQFCRIYGYSVACILFSHFLINLGMTIGLAPVIGIPLPFMSYGGSSLLSFTILLFIFLNLNSYRMDILR